MTNKTSQTQQQTEETFGFKWKKRNSYESPIVQQEWKRWLFEKYFDSDSSRLNKLLSSERDNRAFARGRIWNNDNCIEVGLC